jgi:ATPase family associated with various cellular activities (AAA)
MRQIDQAAMLYHRLILVVAPSGAGKTKALQEVAKRAGVRCINVNLELSRQLLDFTERQRALQVSRVLSDIVGKHDEQVVLLDNMEVLFDVSLKQDPLRCLQGLSRHRTVVAAWNGTIEHGYLIYAAPDHPEYRRYPAGDLLVVSPPAPAES